MLPGWKHKHLSQTSCSGVSGQVPCGSVTWLQSVVVTGSLVMWRFLGWEDPLSGRLMSGNLMAVDRKPSYMDFSISCLIVFKKHGSWFSPEQAGRAEEGRGGEGRGQGGISRREKRGSHSMAFNVWNHTLLHPSVLFIKSSDQPTLKRNENTPHIIQVKVSKSPWIYFLNYIAMK